MKKKFYTLLFALLAIVVQLQAQVVLNAENFPDANFRAALADIFGINEGDEISQEKINATTQINVSDKSISDLKGIEHFTALTILICDHNQLTTLDVSHNTALEYLFCHYNQLTALDMSKNTALTFLMCNGNKLTTLDVSKNTALERLPCSYNQLTTLDVSKNTALTSLECGDNQLTALDVSKNTALTLLTCSYNQLTTLDVSKNTALEYLYCSNNQLTTLDVSKNTALTELGCSNNQIKGAQMDALVNSLPTISSGEFQVFNSSDNSEGNVCTKAQVAIAKSKGWKVYQFNGTAWSEYEGSDEGSGEGVLLNAENFPDANFRAALASELGINEGDEITAEKIASTKRLNVSEKSIADLTGIEYFTALTWLSCVNNQLTALDISNNTALTTLWCNINQLTALDVSNNTALDTLVCGGNQLTTLDVSNNTALTALSCSSNQLTTLDVSNNTALKFLECLYNQLSALDVSNNTALAELRCHYNQLTALDVSNNIALTRLYCTSNQLTALNVSNNTALTGLSCAGNQLTTLDVSKNTALKELYCYNNQLTALDVSNNTALKELSCTDNQLTALDVSNNTALTRLYCYNNRIQGTNMDSFIQSLPVSGGSLYLIYNEGSEEENEISDAQITNAQGKGWDIYYWENYEWNKVPTGSRPDINDLLGDYTFYYGSSGTTTMDCQLVKTSSGYGLKFTGTPEGIIPVTMSFDNSTIKFKNTQFVGDWKTASVTTDQAIVLLMYTNGTSVYRTRSTTSVGLKGTLSIDPETADVVWTMTGIVPSGYDFYALRVANTSDGTYETITSTNISAWINPVKLVKKKKEIVLNEENFPDANFRAALANILGINEGDEISQEKINATTQIDVGSKSISDLKGIEHFTALEYLDCNNNQLTALDVSNNTALEYLWCYNNQLTTLDVSKNTALQALGCYNNQIAALDLSKNTALRSLTCFYNQLTALDVSKNTALATLSCGFNQLTTLDVSTNTALTFLYCDYNQLSVLNITNNTALMQLGCYNNQLTTLDTSNNTALWQLFCYNNQLTALDTSNNTALTYLFCNNNQLTTLDVSKNTALERLDCYNNQIKGAKMDELVNSMPAVSWGIFSVINTEDENEGNVCTKTQVAVAKAKGWSVRDSSLETYEGSDELILNEDNFTDSNFRATLSQILGISEDDEITPEMIDEITTLNVSNKTISNLKGIEHFKELMVLYCQLNQIKGADMDNLIASLPTIDTSSAAPALNAPRKTSGTWGSLYAYDNTAGNEGNVITTEQVADANAKGWKVYQFNGTAWEEYAGSTTGITIVENNDDAIANWYTLDGKPLSSKPEKAGMYVVKMSNGKTKKVMVK